MVRGSKTRPLFRMENAREEKQKKMTGNCKKYILKFLLKQ